MGYKDIEIMVAETEWAYKGDPNEVGPSVDNVKAYNGSGKLFGLFKPDLSMTYDVGLLKNIQAGTLKTERTYQWLARTVNAQELPRQVVGVSDMLS
ncbi:Glycoside hydrolase, catalytic domain-containing protein [Artemisia annua]|uniref:Glycoside hydrolase, catalytic domain-containing protein n=1 Tax=Artemisia annua TaxID=35608 RepID=A0A2U1KCR0_ARTAN|nr:Glycoside hydrolase, catalytic domain-containing protein [Artemisia annua]